MEQITQKFESNVAKAQSSDVGLENSNNIINEIDKIIGIYEKSSGPKEKIPFNEILISSVDPKISMDIPDGKKGKPLGSLILASALGLTVLASGYIYSSELYDYSTKALTAAGILKKEPVSLVSDEDSSSTPPQVVLEPVENVVQPVAQPVTPAIAQPVNKSDVGR